MTARPWGPVIAFCLLAGALVNANNEEGLGRFHLGHHHSRERTHSHPEANHVQWTSVLTADQHARSLGYMGTKDALRRVIRKLQGGQPIVMTVIGGSVSALNPGDTSHAAAIANGHEGSWSKRLFDTIAQTWPNAGHKYINAAVPNAGSAYFAACLERHVPKDSDVILMELAVADPFGTTDTQAAVEQIVRRLYHWKSPMPAMVFVNYWDNWPGAPPQTWQSFQELGAWNPAVRGSTEEILLRVAQYYDVPLVSFKNAMLVEDLQMTPGYSYEDFAETWNRPNAVGHHMLADAVFGLFYTALSVENTEAQCPAGNFEDQPMAPLDVLPPALVRDNNATAPLACFAGGRWDPAEAAQGQGFALRASGADAGFAAESAGATLKVKLGASVGKFIGVSYVRAPKGMGKALVTCGGTCDCGSHDLEGHVDGDKAVVTHAKLKVKGEKGGGTDCVVEITAETSSLSTGGAAFRVVGVAAGPTMLDGARGWPAGHDDDVGAYISSLAA